MPALDDEEARRRADREREAFDERAVWEKNNAWQLRVRHVLEGPNTQRHERTFADLLRTAVQGGGRGLDVGCADGATTQQLLDMGASYALGIDVAATDIAKARTRAVPGRLEFRLGSVHEPIDGRFDLIYGRSILHHLDFREFLSRAFRDNLAPGGRMIFMEPLSHPFAIAFHKLVPSAHTEDEWPLTRRDLTWMRRTFPGTELIPINLVSFATGIGSTLVSNDPGNRVMRLSDRADEWLARRIPAAGAYYRQGIIVIHG